MRLELRQAQGYFPLRRQGAAHGLQGPDKAPAYHLVIFRGCRSRRDPPGGTWGGAGQGSAAVLSTPTRSATTLWLAVTESLPESLLTSPRGLRGPVPRLGAIVGWCGIPPAWLPSVV